MTLPIACPFGLGSASQRRRLGTPGETRELPASQLLHERHRPKSTLARRGCAAEARDQGLPAFRPRRRPAYLVNHDPTPQPRSAIGGSRLRLRVTLCRCSSRRLARTRAALSLPTVRRLTPERPTGPGSEWAAGRSPVRLWSSAAS